MQAYENLLFCHPIREFTATSGVYANAPWTRRHPNTIEPFFDSPTVIAHLFDRWSGRQTP
jgi:hypothetical protein